MAASITLANDPSFTDQPALFKLGEVDVTIGEGEPKRLFGMNNGTTKLRGITVAVDGEAAPNIQLAIDNDGAPGVWADFNQPIRVVDGNLEPGGTFSFWARPTFSIDDVEGIKEFSIVIDTTSLG